MASKKYLELQGHSDEDLLVELKSAQQEYQQMRFDNYTKGIESVTAIKDLRRDIARLKTEIRRRELENETEGDKRLPNLSRKARLQIKQS